MSDIEAILEALQGGRTVDYEVYFMSIKDRVVSDLGETFETSLLDNLKLSLIQRRQNASHDQYRSKAAKVPAYYNPNTHSIHLNINVIETASQSLIENIYYHELLHAASHHAKITLEDQRILKSGLKVQVWDNSDNQHTLHRSLNEGVTQYFANMYTAGGPAYKNEVAIIGQLVRRIGLNEIKAAYFGPHIDLLEEKTRVTIGEGVFQQLSQLVEKKDFEAAEALLSH